MLPHFKDVVFALRAISEPGSPIALGMLPHNLFVAVGALGEPGSPIALDTFRVIACFHEAVMGGFCSSRIIDSGSGRRSHKFWRRNHRSGAGIIGIGAGIVDFCAIGCFERSGGCCGRNIGSTSRRKTRNNEMSVGTILRACSSCLCASLRLDSWLIY